MSNFEKASQFSGSNAERPGVLTQRYQIYICNIILVLNCERNFDGNF